MIYRLRLTRSESELILDYREQGAAKWVFAAGCEFSDPAQAHKEFAALGELRPPAYGVLEAFRELNCIIPAALSGGDREFVMSDRDFIEKS